MRKENPVRKDGIFSSIKALSKKKESREALFYVSKGI